MVMRLECDSDSFLDFLNDLKGKGFIWKNITKEEYNLLKDQYEIQAYAATTDK